MTIAWDDLLKNRTFMPKLRNSAHMLECRRKVLAKRPDATIVAAGPNLWKLIDKDVNLSNTHNSQYACWAEARKIMESL